MPICGFCGEEVEAVYECKECGISFCWECGSVERGLCLYCEEEAEYIEEDVGCTDRRKSIDDEEVRWTDEI